MRRVENRRETSRLRGRGLRFERLEDRRLLATYQFSTARFAYFESQVQANIVVNRSGPADGAIVSLSITGGTLGGNNDYVAHETSHVFGDLEFSHAYKFTFNAFDFTAEIPETLELDLMAPTPQQLGAISSTVVHVIDINGGPATAFEFANANYNVGEGAGTASVLVRRLGIITLPGSVNYSTSQNSALPVSDYTHTTGTLSFAIDEEFKSFTVPITNDADPENPETFRVMLQSPSSLHGLGRDQATVTIHDNDSTFKLSAAAYEAREDSGTATINVLRSGDLSVAASVSYAANTGTAVLGEDFALSSGVLSFAINQASASFTVNLTNDSRFETAETINLALSGPTNGATLATPSTAVLTLIDDDGASDFDGDNDIDGADFLVWQRGVGTPAAMKSHGDADRDGDVDASDLAVWSQRYGTTSAGIAASTRSGAWYAPIAALFADYRSLLPELEPRLPHAGEAVRLARIDAPRAGFWPRERVFARTAATHDRPGRGRRRQQQRARDSLNFLAGVRWFPASVGVPRPRRELPRRDRQ